MTELDRMASEMHEAEMKLERALTEKKQFEEEMKSKFNQANAELSAAMEALRVSREKNQILRNELERLR